MIRLQEQDAVRLARSLYGLAAAARALPSERDQNFALSTERGAFVLKISGAAEKREALDLQNEALAWLAARASALPLPRLVSTTTGAAIGDADGRFVRLLTYLPGAILADAKPQTPALLGAVGRLLGELDRALEGFAHPAASGRDLLWNPDRALEIIARHRDAIRDPARRALVDAFVADHARSVAPLTGLLPRGIIHNDANDYNVLVGDPAPAGRPVAGLLDFGDMVETWTVCELAVAIAYAIFGKEDPLDGRLPPRGRIRPDAPADGSRARGALELHGDPTVHERLSLRAPPHRRARQPLPDGERGPGVGSPRAHARGPSAPGPLSPARRVRAHAVSADAGHRGVDPRSPRGNRARGRRSPRPGRRLRPLGRQPALCDARRDDRHAGHDREALRGHARARTRRSGSAATTRPACST